MWVLLQATCCIMSPAWSTHSGPPLRGEWGGWWVWGGGGRGWAAAVSYIFYKLSGRRHENKSRIQRKSFSQRGALLSISINIFYIYMCVCVCAHVCVWVMRMRGALSHAYGQQSFMFRAAAPCARPNAPNSHTQQAWPTFISFPPAQVYVWPGCFKWDTTQNNGCRRRSQDMQPSINTSMLTFVSGIPS